MKHIILEITNFLCLHGYDDAATTLETEMTPRYDLRLETSAIYFTVPVGQTPTFYRNYLKNLPLRQLLQHADDIDVVRWEWADADNYDYQPFTVEGENQ